MTINEFLTRIPKDRAPPVAPAARSSKKKGSHSCHKGDRPWKPSNDNSSIPSWMFYEGENQFQTRATDTEHAEHVPRKGWKAFKQPPKRGSKQPPKSRSERRRKGHKAEDWTMEAQESTTGPKQSPASKQDSEQPPPKQDHKQPPRESFSNTTRTHTNIMDAITSRTLIEMGFTEEQAYRGIAAISPCTDAQRAVEWLLEHGKKNEPSKVLSQKTSKKIIFENLIRAGYDEVAVRAALLIIGNKQSDYVVEHKVVDWLLRMGVTKSAPTTAKNDTSTPTSAKVSQKNCSEVKLPECVVCLERSVEETIVPCGHMCLCTSCARQMKGTGATCPICRTNIHTTVKVYI